MILSVYTHGVHVEGVCALTYRQRLMTFNFIFKLHFYLLTCFCRFTVGFAAFFTVPPVRCHSGPCRAARISSSRGFGGVPVAASSLHNSWLRPWGDEDAAGHSGNVVFVRFGLLWHHHFYSHHLDAHVHYRQVRLGKLALECNCPSFRFSEAVSSQDTRNFQRKQSFHHPLEFQPSRESNEFHPNLL